MPPVSPVSVDGAKAGRRLTDMAMLAAAAVVLIVTVLQPWCGRDRVAVSDLDDINTGDNLNPVATLGALVQPGDLVLVHPPWRDDLADKLRPKLQRNTRGVDVTTAFTRPHGGDWPALLVVAEGVHPWPASIEDRREALQVDVVDVPVGDGGDVLRVFRLPAGADGPSSNDAQRGSDLPIEAASVTVRTADGGTVACSWNAGRRRHVCAGLPEWMYVGDVQLTVGGSRQSCIWSHPITDGEVIVTWPARVVGPALQLSLALSDAAADNPTGAAVVAQLTVNAKDGDGDTKNTALQVKGRRGFVTKRIPVRDPADAHSVRLVLTTPHDGQRHTCFRLQGVAP